MSKKKGSDGNALGVSAKTPPGSPRVPSAKKRPGFPPTPSRAPAQAPKKTIGWIDRIVDTTARLEQQADQQAAFLIEMRKDILSRLPVPAQHDPEPWVPKKGDLVIGTAAIALHGMAPMPNEVGTVTWFGGAKFERVDVRFASCTEAGAYFWKGPHAHVRLATPDEVTRYQAEQEKIRQEEEWAKVTELQEGDACRATKQQQRGFLKKLNEAGLLDYSSTYMDPEGCTWKPNGYPNAPFQFGIHGPEIPVDIWERRLEGTIARKKLDREEEERNKPIECGTPVMSHIGRGVYWYKLLSGKHKIVANGGAYEEIDRDQFTIIPTP